MMHRRGLVAGHLVVVGLAATVAACDVTLDAAQLKVREHSSFTVKGTPTINIGTFDGSIELRGWDKPVVDIEVVKQAPDQASADAIKVDARQDGDTVTLDIPQPDSFRNRSWYRSPTASVIVSVPRSATLVLRSGDGSIRVSRVDGSLDLRSDDGSIHVDTSKGRVWARSADGSIAVTDVEGVIDLETSDGSVKADGIVRSVRISTNDGSVQLTAREGSRMDSEWAISTGDGSIHAELPHGFSAAIDARTGDGRVTVDGLSSQNRRGRSDDDEDGRRQVQGDIGSGGKPFRLRSGDGSVNVQVW